MCQGVLTVIGWTGWNEKGRINTQIKKRAKREGAKRYRANWERAKQQRAKRGAPSESDGTNYLSNTVDKSLFFNDQSTAKIISLSGRGVLI